MSNHECQRDTLAEQYKELIENKPKQCSGSANLYEPLYIAQRFDCPHLFKGYGVQKDKQNPFYRTTNSEYGYFTPNPHTVPHQFFPKSQTFSTHLDKCGMYRNFSLNTIMDKTYY